MDPVSDTTVRKCIILRLEHVCIRVDTWKHVTRVMLYTQFQNDRMLS